MTATQHTSFAYFMSLIPPFLVLKDRYGKICANRTRPATLTAIGQIEAFRTQVASCSAQEIDALRARKTEAQRALETTLGQIAETERAQGRLQRTRGGLTAVLESIRKEPAGSGPQHVYRPAYATCNVKLKFTMSAGTVLPDISTRARGISDELRRVDEQLQELGSRLTALRLIEEQHRAAIADLEREAQQRCALRSVVLPAKLEQMIELVRWASRQIRQQCARAERKMHRPAGTDTGNGSSEATQDNDNRSADGVVPLVLDKRVIAYMTVMGLDVSNSDDIALVQLAADPADLAAAAELAAA